MEHKDIKILIADEEEALVSMPEKFLRYEGFTTFTALNGKDALEIFKKERPHLTIMDIFLGYQPMDGIELFQKIKAVDPEAKCLMMTFHSFPEAIARAKEAGVKEYMEKPFGLEKLLDRVKKILGI